MEGALASLLVYRKRKRLADVFVSGSLQPHPVARVEEGFRMLLQRRRGALPFPSLISISSFCV